MRDATVISDNEATGSDTSSLTDGGGGLFLRGSAVIEGGTVSGNRAVSHGGGILNKGELTITDSDIGGNIVEDNSADEGGGLYQTQSFGSGSNANTVIEGSTFRNNSAEDGGILHEGGVLTLQNGSLLTGNSAGNRGGGLFAREGPEAFRETIAFFDNSTVSNNDADFGGGIYHDGAEVEVTLTNSVVTGNSGIDGGGILVMEGLFALTGGSAVRRNVADNNGGGVMNAAGTMTIDDSIVGGLGPVIAPIRADTNQTTFGDGNEADLGGGIYNEGILTITTGGRVSDNTARDPAPSGGGIYNLGTLTNSGTVTGNTPDQIAP